VTHWNFLHSNSSSYFLFTFLCFFLDIDSVSRSIIRRHRDLLCGANNNVLFDFETSDTGSWIKRIRSHTRELDTVAFNEDIDTIIGVRCYTTNFEFLFIFTVVSRNKSEELTATIGINNRGATVRFNSKGVEDIVATIIPLDCSDCSCGDRAQRNGKT